MILLEEVLPLQFSPDFLNSFYVVIQLSSILAVVILYFDRLWPFGKRKESQAKQDAWALWLRIFLAALPAAVIGFLFDDAIDRYLYTSKVLAISLVLYGVVFLLIGSRGRETRISQMKELDLRTALQIGFFQVLALVPGTSRSGATIIGAILLGCSPGLASEFSFVLAIPMMAGASLLKLVKSGLSFLPMEWAVLLTACLSSFLVSMLAVKGLIAYVRRRGFRAFGYYRIALGLIVLLFFQLRGSTL